MTQPGRFTLYELLRLRADASAAEIKAAFRALAQKHHPDKHGNSTRATSRFRVIHNAYAILSDPESREAYDRVLARGGRTPERYDRNRSSTREGLPSSGLGELPSVLLDHLNFVLWEIEELVLPRKGRGSLDAGAEPYLLKMLTFLDRWVLQRAGFPDYFFQARGLKPPSETAAPHGLPFQNLSTGHRPYVDTTDYFYNVRRRVDQLSRNIRLLDFSAALPGESISLADCILESHNYCLHYLGWIKRPGAFPPDGELPDFVHSQPAFEQAPEGRPASD